MLGNHGRSITKAIFTPLARNFYIFFTPLLRHLFFRPRTALYPQRRPADSTSAGLLPMTNLSVPKEGVERTLLQAPPVIRQA